MYLVSEWMGRQSAWFYLAVHDAGLGGELRNISHLVEALPNRDVGVEYLHARFYVYSHSVCEMNLACGFDSSLTQPDEKFKISNNWPDR